LSEDLLLQLKDTMSLLDKALKELGRRGQANAQAEQNYRISLAEKMLIERDKKTPVTILSDVCRGDRQIAKLKFERDVAEVMYKSALEAINCFKIQVKVLENQIDREWNRA
jgi:hypothetical protein